VFKKDKEFFLKMSLFFIQFYKNIVDRKYNDYECSAQIPSEIECFFDGRLSVLNIDS
jgi:hypothetical protein